MPKQDQSWKALNGHGTYKVESDSLKQEYP